MSSFQFWPEIAAPTTPPGQWEQSLKERGGVEGRAAGGEHSAFPAAPAIHHCEKHPLTPTRPQLPAPGNGFGPPSPSLWLPLHPRCASVLCARGSGEQNPMAEAGPMALNPQPNPTAQCWAQSTDTRRPTRFGSPAQPMGPPQYGTPPPAGHIPATGSPRSCAPSLPPHPRSPLTFQPGVRGFLYVLHRPTGALPPLPPVQLLLHLLPGCGWRAVGEPQGRQHPAAPPHPEPLAPS